MAPTDQNNQWIHNEKPRGPMIEIEKLLNLGDFSTSSGGTVRKDFMIAVAEGLGVRLPRQSNGDLERGVTKEVITEWAWRKVNDGPMPQEALSRGGTITNVALEGILNGIKREGIDRSKTQPTFVADIDFGGSTPDLTELVDSRKKAIRTTLLREGQAGFRREVMRVYGGSCCVTNTEVPEALEAAHIVDYRGVEFNHITNGLALRGDIHTLYDRGLLAIHENSFEILLDPKLEATDQYGDLAGRTITLPQDSANHPHPKFLQAHRIASGFLELKDSTI